VPVSDGPRKPTRRLEDFLRSERERTEARHAEWAAGRIELGGFDVFAGVGDPILRDSYLAAARELLDKNRGNLLKVAVPILFLQRHSLEVALKDSIRIVAYYHYFAHKYRGPEPEAPRTHNLKKLLRCLIQWSDPSELKDTLNIVKRLVERFHKLDPGGTYLRYRDDARPVKFDLDESQRELRAMFKHYFSRDSEALGWITSYEEEIQSLAVREYLEREGAE
jgi:hypothetical protein